MKSHKISLNMKYTHPQIKISYSKWHIRHVSRAHKMSVNWLTACWMLIGRPEWPVVDWGWNSWEIIILKKISFFSFLVFPLFFSLQFSTLRKMIPIGCPIKKCEKRFHWSFSLKWAWTWFGKIIRKKGMIERTRSETDRLRVNRCMAKIRVGGHKRERQNSHNTP